MNMKIGPRLNCSAKYGKAWGWRTRGDSYVGKWDLSTRQYGSQPERAGLSWHLHPQSTGCPGRLSFSRTALYLYSFFTCTHTPCLACFVPLLAVLLRTTWIFRVLCLLTPLCGSDSLLPLGSLSVKMSIIVKPDSVLSCSLKLPQAPGLSLLLPGHPEGAYVAYTHPRWTTTAHFDFFVFESFLKQQTVAFRRAEVGLVHCRVVECLTQGGTHSLLKEWTHPSPNNCLLSFCSVPGTVWAVASAVVSRDKVLVLTELTFYGPSSGQVTDTHNTWVRIICMLEGSDRGKLMVVSKGDWESQGYGLQCVIGWAKKASLRRHRFA